MTTPCVDSMNLIPIQKTWVQRTYILLRYGNIEVYGLEDER